MGYAILSMILSASLVIVCVLVLRGLLRGLPKRITVFLWAIVFFRLLCPVTIESPLSVFSLLPEEFSIRTEEEAVQDPAHTDHGEAVTPALPIEGQEIYEMPGEAPEGNVQPVPAGQEQTPGNAGEGAAVVIIEPAKKRTQNVLCLVLGSVWALGFLAMLGRELVLTVKLKKRLALARPLSDNVYISDRIRAPFSLGLVKPIIYLPEGLREDEQRYTLLHERMHLKYGDQVFKAIAFLALAIHWFNPLVWLAFRAFSKDLEFACDERVIRNMEEPERASYADVLFHLSGADRILTSALTFDGGNVKGRITRILGYKKAGKSLMIAAAVILAAAAVVFGTSACKDTAPETAPAGKTPDESASTPSIDDDNAKAVGYCQRIRGYINSHPDSDFSKHVTYIYITEDNRPAMVITCEDESCRKVVSEELGCDNAAFRYEPDSGNWEDREKTIQQTYHRFWNENKDRTDLSSEDKRLIKMVRAINLDWRTGKVVVDVFASHEVADYINKITDGKGIDSAEGENAFSWFTRLDPRYREFMADIRYFREKISDSDAIIFRPSPKVY
ncbi:MAG: M56 family metallopeptidase [Lachnospiraceae bacterium]|nr:M56 family metallopeptidase [Lachnospiraceae bacterium]